MAEGSAEVYVDWKSGKGTLRRVAPSGMTTDTAINAERYRGMIIADDVHSTDLVVHAAIVREHNGKQQVRLDSSSWLTCH